MDVAPRTGKTCSSRSSLSAWALSAICDALLQGTASDLVETAIAPLARERAERGRDLALMKGVTIGDGAIVGSLSVVTKDVPPYAIVAGKPAQFIKWRHPEAIGRRLQALAWWDWDHETLHRALADFRSLTVEAFLDRYEERESGLARASR